MAILWPSQQNPWVLMTKSEANFWIPFLITLSFLFSLIATLKVRGVVIPVAPAAMTVVLLPLVVGMMAQTTASERFDHILVLCVTGLITIGYCASLWPFARQHRGAKLLVILMLSQLTVNIITIGLMLNNPNFLDYIGAHGWIMTSWLIGQFLLEISKTLGFILLLNERQFSVLKMINENLDQRIADGTAELKEKNRLLQMEITQRLAIEENLRAEEYKYRRLAESIPSKIMRTSLAGVIEYMNPEMLKMLGLSAHEVISKHYSKVFLKDHFPDVEEANIARITAATSGKIVYLEHELPFPTGTEIHSVTFIPERNEHGEVCAVITIGTDITEQKKAENALRERELKYRTLAESIPFNMVRHDLDGRINYMNAAMEKAMQVERGCLIGKTIHELFPPKLTEYQIIIDTFYEALKTKSIVEFEVNMPTALGVLHTHYVRHIPEFDETGSMYSILTMGQDISHRKSMELALRQRELEFRTLADNFPYVIIRYNTQFHRTYVNKQYEKNYHIARGHVLNKPIDCFWSEWHGITLEEYLANLQKVIHTKCSLNFFTKLLDEDGNTSFQEMLLVPEFNDEDKVTGVIAIGHNTNMYDKALLDLKELNSKLKILSAEKEFDIENERNQIAREIHDELGQQLSVLHLNASTIDFLYGHANSDISAKAKNMMRVSEQALDTVRNLITRLRPAIINIGLSYALKCLMDEFSRNTNIDCQLTLPDDDLHLGELTTFILFRIVQESFTNIMRHAAATQVKVTVQLTGKQLTISIQDNGCGLQQSAVNRPDAFGIICMHERMMMLGGRIEINNLNDQSEGTGNTGTEVIIQVNIDQNKANRLPI